MSYCRFSSDNWRSDVYVYEDCAGGWTTHVAARRRPIPPIPDIMMGDLSLRLHEWAGARWNKEARRMEYASRWRSFLYGTLWCGLSSWWHRRIHMGSLRLIPLRPIGLPFDGETFNHDTPRECAEHLLRLRGLGYHVPQRAIDALLREAEELETGAGLTD